MKKLLVVDDEPTIQALYKAMFTHAGFKVITAADGNAALKIYRKRGPFDVVITDMCHPGPDGAELIQAIRRKNPTQLVLFHTSENFIKQLAYLNVQTLCKGSVGPTEVVRLVEKMTSSVPMPGAQ